MIRNTAFLLCKGINIGYISDVHSEFVKSAKCLRHVGERKCDVLLLAGDIGDPFSHSSSYRRFLEACTGIAKHTLVLAGNHEYYQNNRYSMTQTKTKITSLCRAVDASNEGRPQCGTIRFMDNEVFTYKDQESQQSVRFICSTLWSDVSKENEGLIYNKINDYGCIMGFTPNRSRELFNTASHFINENLTDSDGASTTTDIVVTHHAPTPFGVSDPKFIDSPLSSAFSSVFKYSPNKRPPYAWIFGHTHYNVARYDTDLRTILLSNQIGYPGEDCGFVCDWDAESVKPPSTPRG